MKFFQEGSSGTEVDRRSVLNITLISYTPLRYVSARGVKNISMCGRVYLAEASLAEHVQKVEVGESDHILMTNAFDAYTGV